MRRTPVVDDNPKYLKFNDVETEPASAQATAIILAEAYQLLHDALAKLEIEQDVPERRRYKAHHECLQLLLAYNQRMELIRASLQNQNEELPELTSPDEDNEGYLFSGNIRREFDLLVHVIVQQQACAMVGTVVENSEFKKERLTQIPIAAKPELVKPLMQALTELVVITSSRNNNTPTVPFQEQYAQSAYTTVVSAVSSMRTIREQSVYRQMVVPVISVFSLMSSVNTAGPTYALGNMFDSGYLKVIFTVLALIVLQASAEANARMVIDHADNVYTRKGWSLFNYLDKDSLTIKPLSNVRTLLFTLTIPFITSTSLVFAAMALRTTYDFRYWFGFMSNIIFGLLSIVAGGLKLLSLFATLLQDYANIVRSDSLTSFLKNLLLPDQFGPTYNMLTRGGQIIYWGLNIVLQIICVYGIHALMMKAGSDSVASFQQDPLFVFKVPEDVKLVAEELPGDDEADKIFNFGLTFSAAVGVAPFFMNCMALLASRIVMCFQTKSVAIETMKAFCYNFVPILGLALYSGVKALVDLIQFLFKNIFFVSAFVLYAAMNSHFGYDLWYAAIPLVFISSIHHQYYWAPLFSKLGDTMFSDCFLSVFLHFINSLLAGYDKQIINAISNGALAIAHKIRAVISGEFVNYGLMATDAIAAALNSLVAVLSSTPLQADAQQVALAKANTNIIQTTSKEQNAHYLLARIWAKRNDCGLLDPSDEQRALLNNVYKQSI